MSTTNIYNINIGEPVRDVKWSAATRVLRNTIGENMAVVKERLFMNCNRCGECGEEMEFNDCHIDHFYPQFIDIVVTYLKSRDILYKDLEIERVYTDEGFFRLELVDKKLEADWIEYHNMMASVRLLHKEENMRRPKLRASKLWLLYEDIEIPKDVTPDALYTMKLELMGEKRKADIIEVNELEERTKKKRKSKKPRKPNPWNIYCRKYAKEHDMTYYEACKVAGPSYRAQKELEDADTEEMEEVKEI